MVPYPHRQLWYLPKTALIVLDIPLDGSLLLGESTSYHLEPGLNA